MNNETGYLFENQQKNPEYGGLHIRHVKSK